MDGVLLGIELLIDRCRLRAMDQRIGRGNRGRRVLRQSLAKRASGGFQFAVHDIGDKSQVIGCCADIKLFFGKVYLQRAAQRRRVGLERPTA